MTTIRKSTVQSGGKLLKKLVDKLDTTGDLAPRDVRRAAGGGSPVKRRGGAASPPPAADRYTSNIDNSTRNALMAAAMRGQSAGDRSAAAIKRGVDQAVHEVLAADVDGSGTITDTEQKRLKRLPLALALVEFAKEHATDPVSAFHFAPVAGAYHPAHPFRVRDGASPAEIATSLVKHFDAHGNDNYWPGAVSRWVLGEDESKGIVAELARMPRSLAKPVLRALSDQVRSQDIPRPYIQPAAVHLFEHLAGQLGLARAGFTAEAKPPKFPGY